HPPGGHRPHLLFRFCNGARRLEQLRQNLLDLLGHQESDRQARADEVEPFLLLKQHAERLPEVGDVEDQDRFLVPAELRPGELLDQLLERPDTARKRDEGVGTLEHHPFALVHVGRDDPLLHAQQQAVRPAFQKAGGQPPARPPAVIEDGFGERSHQPHRPAAINQADAVLGENSAELPRRVHESWVVAGAGGAVDANRLDGHACCWFKGLHCLPGVGGTMAAKGNFGKCLTRRPSIRTTARPTRSCREHCAPPGGGITATMMRPRRSCASSTYTCRAIASWFASSPLCASRKGRSSTNSLRSYDRNTRAFVQR